MKLLIDMNLSPRWAKYLTDAGMEAAHSDMADQLATMAANLTHACAELRRTQVALVQAQAAAVEWQDAYNGAVEGKAFYEQLFCDKCKEAVRA